MNIRRHHKWFILLSKYFIPGLVLLVIGLLFFGSAGRDDAHITYWPAYTLAHYGEILNYNGIRVEQSSSLLQVVLLAVAAKFTGIEMVTLGKLSSLIFGITSIILIASFTTKITIDHLSGFSAAIITATHPYFVYWSFGGLESTLVSFLGIFLILIVSNYINNKKTNLILVILAMGLFEIVRPENPILLGCLLSSAIVLALLKQAFSKYPDNTTSSRLIKLFWIYILISIIIFAFKLWYFGTLFPQPVTAKSDGIDLTYGIYYLKKNFFWNGYPILFLSFVIGISFFITLIKSVRTGELNNHLTFSFLYIAGYISFITLAGGDWMEGGRFLVHFIPVLISMIPITITSITKNKLLLIVITFLIVSLQLKSVVEFTKTSSTGIPLWSQAKTSRSYNVNLSWFERHNRVNMRDVYIIDYLDYLVTEISTVHKPVTIMSAQMGIIPYHISINHFGNVMFFDRAGLTDRTFTTCEVTRDRPKGNGGIDVSYEFYFENLSEITQKCTLTKPDIIFDISVSDLTTQLLINNGYTIMYMQTGDVTTDKKWLEDYIVRGRQILGVRTDILESLDKIRPVFIKLKE